MPKWVAAARDRKLDWFFDEYVYGTEVPHYDVSSDFKGVTTFDQTVKLGKLPSPTKKLLLNYNEDVLSD